MIKEDGKYLITRAGKSAYSRMLQNYDLDRQTILEEEGKRIEEITNKTIEFFDKFRIKDKDIQFRFLTNILKLDYEKVKPLLKEEEIFHKIILFLSINHPDQYPSFISPEDFSDLYKIKKTTLDYYIDEISGGKIYPLRFFKLVKSGEQYYFQSDGGIERILRVITENQIAKTTYMTKLFSKGETSTIDMKTIIDDIGKKVCEFLINKDLKASLKELLPEYIKYLAYKITTKRKLKETNDKLEGIIWQKITEIFELQTTGNLDYQEQIKEIDNEMELNPEDLGLYYSKIRILIYFNQYKETINLLDNLLEIFPESEKDIKILKAAVLRRMQNIEAGLDIINELIQKFPNDNDLNCYKAYWMQYLENKEEAIKIIEKLTKIEPKNGLYLDTFGEILMAFEDYEEAIKKFLKAIVISSDDWYIHQTYIKLGICYKALEIYDLALQNLKKGKELTNKGSANADTKHKWLSIADLFLLEIEQLI
jgi:tetratricopeptide (TPR) repeat protein